MKNNFIIFLVILAVSCDSPKLSVEDKNIARYVEEEVSSELLKKDFNLIYLVLRDCSCVVENIDFIAVNFSNYSKPKVTTILLVQPDNSKYYLDILEKSFLNLHKDIIVKIDYNNDFLKYGNLFVEDYLFEYRNRKFTKIEIKSSQFSSIKKLL